MPDWLPYLITAVLSLLVAFVSWVIFRAFPAFRRFTHFIDDVAGEEERPGVAARPGLMVRIGGLETQMTGLESQVETIHHETTPNHGGSIKDEIRRVEAQGIRTAEAVAAHVEQTAVWTEMLTDLHDQWSKKPWADPGNPRASPPAE